MPISYYRARYYSPNIGRFISRDPLPDAELSQGANLYWYVQNNAVNVVDPSGLKMCCGDELAAAKKACSEAIIEAGFAAALAVLTCGSVAAGDLPAALVSSTLIHYAAFKAAEAYDECHQCDNQ
jgi:uncharacterized protein RhaS with RHS repeats